MFIYKKNLPINDVVSELVFESLFEMKVFIVKECEQLHHTVKDIKISEVPNSDLTYNILVKVANREDCLVWGTVMFGYKGKFKNYLMCSNCECIKDKDVNNIINLKIIHAETKTEAIRVYDKYINHPLFNGYAILEIPDDKVCAVYEVISSTHKQPSSILADVYELLYNNIENSKYTLVGVSIGETMETLDQQIINLQIIDIGTENQDYDTTKLLSETIYNKINSYISCHSRMIMSIPKDKLNDVNLILKREISDVEKIIYIMRQCLLKL